MAPKSKSNAAIKTIEFEEYFPEITENGKKVRSRHSYLKPILREGGLTEDILVNGNLEDLQRFYKEREGQLNQQEREYMEARIESAEKIRALRHSSRSWTTRTALSAFPAFGATTSRPPATAAGLTLSPSSSRPGASTCRRSRSAAGGRTSRAIRLRRSRKRNRVIGKRYIP